MSHQIMESTFQEERVFLPPKAFYRTANIKSLEEYQYLYDQAKAEPEKFWGKLAQQELHWFRQWDKVLDWQPPFAQWFVGGKLNIS